MNRADVVIVGGGLAGLACALRLEEADVDYVLLEGSDQVGGRVRTDLVEGYRLDRGFQVLLKNYPEARRLLDFESLELQDFESGALVRFDGKFHTLADPWRSPLKGLSTIGNPIGSLWDKVRVHKLRERSLAYINGEKVSTQGSAMEALVSLGFSSSMIDRFFRPFLGGVFLDTALAVPAEMLYFVFGHFARGGAAIPALGMQAIPDQLASHLDGNRIRTGQRVTSVQPNSVVTASGDSFWASHVVMATDRHELSQLRDDLPERGRWRQVTNYYFLAERDPIGKPILVLNGDGRGPINNLSFQTTISPGGSDDERALLSVTVLGLADESTTRAVNEQLVRWFGGDAVGWRLLKTYYLPWALPPVCNNLPKDPMICGDHTTHASIEGALLSGRRVSEHILGAI